MQVLAKLSKSKRRPGAGNTPLRLLARKQAEAAMTTGPHN
jgi:hypothetical protein